MEMIDKALTYAGRKHVDLQAFLGTAVNFDEVGKMSPAEKVGNILLAPHRYLFDGVDVKYSESKIEITSSYDLNPATKALRIVAGILLSPLLITATVIGGLAKWIGRSHKTNPEGDEVEILSPNYLTRHKVICDTLFDSSDAPKRVEVQYSELERFTKQNPAVHNNWEDDLSLLVEYNIYSYADDDEDDEDYFTHDTAMLISIG